MNGSEKPENFYKRIEWKQGDEFEITPEHLDNKIGNYQIDIEFYQDESYNEKLFCESIRGFFRYCPISIENNNLLIFPSNDDKEDFEISICSLNEQLLSIECSEIEFISKFVENRINWLALVPKNLDQFEIVFKSVNSENSVKLRPYIPRLKWRLNNISEFENFSDIALNLDFDEKFYFSKNLTLEIRIISKNAINDLFISYNDNRIPLKISDSNDFIYSFPLNSIYEEINKSIKKGGVSSLFLIIEDEKINLLQMSGKLGEFYDHEPPKPRRCMKVNRSKRIGTHRNILTELKNKGYIKSKPKKVVATLISVISDELGLDKMNLFKMIFSDHSLEAKVNQFLSLNNCNLESGMTYGEFLSGLWDKPLNKMLEMILYIEQKK